MKKILLACAGGFSTSMLVAKMQGAATSLGIPAEINAVADSDIEEHLDVEVILLGPQIAHRLSDIKEVTNIPVAVIDSFDYGTMNGENVLRFALEKISEMEGVS
ncbi:PTS sugar transporter subunit IIB [Enterococcus sp. 2201sp1_2201st1_B8_2201SCRN_220225]|uniref:PTS sugar transporter subunit IIB n=1 Tax=unclassified Enterococcus TaxID=2608891 RepID=UPI0034A4EFC9